MWWECGCFRRSLMNECDSLDRTIHFVIKPSGDDMAIADTHFAVEDRYEY